MQIKTIKKVITQKLEEWLATISDEKLRKDVKENILVSGGCITSMLQGQPVNDYDIYLMDMDVLVKLARYYKPGKVLDGRQKDAYIKDRFPRYDPAHPYLNDHSDYYDDSDEYDPNRELYTPAMLVRLLSLKPDQVKLDIKSEGIRIEPADINPALTYQPAFFSQNAISLTNDIQIVLRFSGSPEKIHSTFDFIHATNYFTFRDGLVMNLEAVQSIITRTLSYQGSFYPLTSIIRMKKFISRGWTINAGEILKIMFQISELNLNDIVILEEQLIGVDVAYFSTLIEILRGVPQEKRCGDYINSIIDKVFNEYDGE